MDTVAQKCWVIRDVKDDVVTMEERVDGEPVGRTTRFGREMLPENIRVGDEFRVVAQLERRSEEALSHPAFGEAAEALAAGAFRAKTA